MPASHSRSKVSRRQVLVGAGTTGLLAATAGTADAATTARRDASGDGTPEQIHLTWGDDPTSSVVVSWASPGRATRPRVRIGRRVIAARERHYTDGSNGETVWTYHALVGGLRPGATYAYVVTADNDANAADPFSATFRTAPAGRPAFRFTSFGDLATPNTNWVLSYGQSAYAVSAVESFQPLFHLLNGDLCYADLNPAVQPEVWRDFGNNNQSSAAFRPWMPCPGNHEVEFDNGPPTPRSTGSSPRCTSAPPPPPPPATARTSASAPRGCRCSTSTGWTSCSTGTTTTTSGRSRAAAWTRESAPTWPPAPRST
ncbi:MAG: purple acid phosphatase family protein, partial [Streptosporangiaceae bacterium]